MKRLLLFSALCAAHWCDAGVTINYEGSAKDRSAVDAILSEATSFGKGRGWRVEPVAKNKVELERVIDEKTSKYTGALRGIILYPHDMCEPVHIEFGSDMFMQDFVKTQFAGAAVLRTLGKPPRFEEFPDPKPSQGEVIVHVKAASLKNIDKMMARGSHYDSHRELPVVCGSDGVGTLDDGTRVFYGGSRPPYGMMAERTVVSRSWCLPIPDGVNDATAAALPNPALSAWLSLVWRAQLKPGETVLILGGTGVAGRLAIQIAKHLGAGRVVAGGRNEQALRRLNDLGADATIHLDQSDQELTKAFIREVGHKPFDVIIDYLWGHPTEVLLGALIGHDVKAGASRIRLVEIGEMAGPTIALPAAASRSSGLELYGSGGGSIPHSAIFDAFPQVWALAASGKLSIDTEQAPLADVETAWQREDLPGRRLVVIP